MLYDIINYNDVTSTTHSYEYARKLCFTDTETINKKKLVLYIEITNFLTTVLLLLMLDETFLVPTPTVCMEFTFDDPTWRLV